MNPDIYRHILVASVAGGVTGMLVMWNRQQGASRARRLGMLGIGTTASACAYYSFAQAFGARSPLFAATLVILLTGWAALAQSTGLLPAPVASLGVGRREHLLLRSPWTGVRAFGALLRHTPLRHLGGPVYWAAAGRDPAVVLRGIYEAELVHFWALAVSCPWLGYWGAQGQWRLLLAGLAVHVPLNLYPILHLRYATWRVAQCVAKAQRRKGV